MTFDADRRPHRCRPFPLLSLLAASFLVVMGITIASLDRSVDFTLYFAAFPPPVAATLACVAGVFALHVLQQRFGFCVVLSRADWRGRVAATAAAVPFMLAVTLADLLLGFPSDTNVSLPTAAVFYPTMAFVAQLILHVTPFAMGLLLLKRLFPAWTEDHRIWLSILLATLPEAVFQSSASYLQGSGLQALAWFVAAQLVAFGSVELYLFRRFDFVSMYLFRLTYYGYWHILWGSMRI